MKKEASLKCKGLRKKTSNEKRGTPKMQGAMKKRLPMKKEAPIKCKGIRNKIARRG
jgi:hypothetical protein